MEKARSTRQGRGKGLCPRTGLPPPLAESAQLTARLSRPGQAPGTFRVLLLHRAERQKRTLSSLCIPSSGAAPRSSAALALRGPVLGALDQASVMGHDFVLWQMKGEFQGH